MAYVKKTDAAFDTLKRNVVQMFTNQKAHAGRWDNYGLTREQIDEKIWNAIMPSDLWNKIQELNAILPDCFVLSNNFRVKISTSSQHEMSTKSYVLYDLVFGSQRAIPYKWVQSFYEYAPICRDSEITKIAIERSAKIESVEQMVQSFLKEVIAAWEAVSSVNAFVKAWPQGRDFLPPDIINRLDQKVERVKPDITINTAALNTELLKAKIMA